MSHHFHRPFGELAKEFANLRDEDIANALEMQKETNEQVGYLLVRMGLLSERDRARILALQWGIPYVEENHPG